MEPCIRRHKGDRKVNPHVKEEELAQALAQAKPLPHKEKEGLLRAHACALGLNTFVETGTYHGEMVQALIEDFDKIYTIEIQPKLFESASRKFEDFPHVQVVFGDSAVRLPEIVSALEGPALFWLDAHMGTSKGHVPLFDELDAIFNDSLEHIVMIDDVRDFARLPHYPDFKDIMKKLCGYDKGIRAITQDDIMRVFLKDKMQLLWDL